MRRNEKRFTMEDMMHSWSQGAQYAWATSGEGWNGEYAGRFRSHDGSVSFAEANPDAKNPYAPKSDISAEELLNKLAALELVNKAVGFGFNVREAIGIAEAFMAANVSREVSDTLVRIASSWRVSHDDLQGLAELGLRIDGFNK